MLPRPLRFSLVATQLVGFATLLRSVAFDRWITVLMSMLLIAGAMAALRRRTWGVGVALAAACWFPVAFAIGIAPAWFCIVGLLGALPFVLASRALVRFDGRATALLAALAAAFGAIGAVAWKQIAFSVFERFPALTPTVEVNHVLPLAALVGAAAFAGRRSLRAAAAAEAGEPARVRVAERVRVHGDGTMARSEVDMDLEPELRRSRRA